MTLPRPVRASDAKASVAREQLLEAASALMTEEGSFDVSLHQIGRKAGVTAPLVKYYFGSKNGLLVALAQRDTAGSLAQLEALMAMDIEPASKLRIHVTGILRTYSRYPYLNGLLDSLLRGDNTEGAQAIRASFVRPLIDAQRRIIAEGIAAGQFRDVDPNYVYFLIIGACQYLFTTRVAFRELFGSNELEPGFPREYAAFAVDYILRGILA